MQLPLRLADAFGQGAFHAHVDAFQLRLEPRPFRPVAVDLGFDLLQPLHDRVALFIRDEFYLREHRRMRDAAGDIALYGRQS